MKSLTCCFSGHRDIPAGCTNYVTNKLTSTLRDMINRGYIFFETGGALGFDTIAAECVLHLKAEFPQIKLKLILPCENQSKGWTVDSVEKYEQIKANADEVAILADHYYRGCMHQRNRRLVDDSSACICYLNKTTGGTEYTVKYAVSKGLTVINVAN